MQGSRADVVFVSCARRWRARDGDSAWIGDVRNDEVMPRKVRIRENIIAGINDDDVRREAKPPSCSFPNSPRTAEEDCESDCGRLAQ